jgi:hypothetical protein
MSDLKHLTDSQLGLLKTAVHEEQKRRDLARVNELLDSFEDAIETKGITEEERQRRLQVAEGLSDEGRS